MSSLPHVARLHLEIEGALARKFVGALSPALRAERERVPVGIPAIDAMFGGGVPVGGVSELVGAASSGRTTVALSLLARATREETAVAWIDVSDTFDPTTAAQCGVDLRRVLWVRGGDAPALREEAVTQAVAMHGGSAMPRAYGGGNHPRFEAHGMPDAVASLLQSSAPAIPDRRSARRIIGTPGAPNRPVTAFPPASPYREEQVPTDRMPARRSVAVARQMAEEKAAGPQKRTVALPESSVAHQLSQPLRELHLAGTHATSWQSLDRALRAADLLLQAGGFSLLVFDLGSVLPEMASRIPLSTWFRFRGACDRTRTTVLLLAQHPLAKSSAEMSVRLQAGEVQAVDGVMTGMRFAAEVERQRGSTGGAGKVVPIRKPPQPERDGAWAAQTAWVVNR